MRSTRRRLDNLWGRRDHTCHWCGRLTVRITDSRQRLGIPCPDNTATLNRILPRRRGSFPAGVRNSVLSCKTCSERMDDSDHCIAAMICAMSVLPEPVRSGHIRRYYEALRRVAGDEENESVFIHGRLDSPRSKYARPAHRMGERQTERV